MTIKSRDGNGGDAADADAETLIEMIMTPDNTINYITPRHCKGGRKVKKKPTMA